MDAVELLTQYGTRVAGVGLLSAAVAGGVALLHRVAARQRLGWGVPMLFGLSAAAAYLNVRAALGELVVGSAAVLAPGTVAFNVLALAVAGLTAPAGRTVGDRVARDLLTATGARELGDGVGRVARSLGRVATVTIPDDVGDIDGYDPVPEATREALAGTTLVFPLDLATAERRERLAARLKEDYDVGYVDAEFDEAGALTHLAVGARRAGLGPTLEPGAAAVAVRADPPNAASPGDLVAVYDRGPPPERVATAEVRAVVGDVVTLACDAGDAVPLAGGDYRVVTLPAEPRPEREFASLLGAADETMAAVTVSAESPFAGTPVGAVDATVVAVRAADGDVHPIPPRTRAVEAGETLYVVAHPAAIRRLEAATGTGPT